MYTSKTIFVILITLLGANYLVGQSTKVFGKVLLADEPASFATVQIKDLSIQTIADINGDYELKNIPSGHHILQFQFLGYDPIQKELQIDKNTQLELNIVFDDRMIFDPVVVTGTNSFQRKTDAPIIVQVLSHKTLQDVQACNLSEGLRFQPGLRVETDCQTCNYTQLRMNGLAGAYSQILVNGRPVISPLTGLYGLEQLPANFVDRIEVIRGGGSSLYGSSAIAGTVNIITRWPKKQSAQANYSHHFIGGQAHDYQAAVHGSTGMINGKFGTTAHLNYRKRDIYDHNGDNFSELPLLHTYAGGSRFLYTPSNNEKWEAHINYMGEYRYGGEMGVSEAHLAQQAEERQSNTWMGGLDYQYNMKNGKGNILAYTAFQYTDRTHYTGILPDEPEMILSFQENPPYGESMAQTWQAGFQWNKETQWLGLGNQLWTLGTEYTQDAIRDEITAYSYLIDQETRNFGAFAQKEWIFNQQFRLLGGTRLDWHNAVESMIFSPRMALLYSPWNNTQLRLSYGTGFRAPQAFDADLHIAFAGGGISRVQLDPNLKEERSQSINLSLNYDFISQKSVAGFTLEAFYTNLDNAFVLSSIGEDQFGEVFLKTNNSGSQVRGMTIETRWNYDQKWQWEAGYTIQSSQFEEAVQYIENVPPIRQFVRTPNAYGFQNLSIYPSKKWRANINYVYTGSMIVPHFAGAENFTQDELFISPNFHNISAKLSYILSLKANQNLEIFTGIKNMLNAYQDDFDMGKFRDSNYIYGPAAPCSIYVGVQWNIQ